ncbi:transcription factor AFT-domain-containing protein [Scheffersomyces xylosifermentans]|uniref:transcription factor AFT-domain-containing protein n=1 Tax=Scheffersomyces xylosifermentans TaxID=1304137 RepID=UPI00315CAAE4
MSLPGASAKQPLSYSLAELQLENQRFSKKDEVKPWLQQRLFELKGLRIVIERSDANKVIFKCKNNSKKEIVEARNTNSKVQVRRQTTCPFKIRANYSSRNRSWSLVVINDQHDHEIIFPPIEDKDGENSQNKSHNVDNRLNQQNPSQVSLSNQNSNERHDLQHSQLHNQLNHQNQHIRSRSSTSQMSHLLDHSQSNQNQLNQHSRNLSQASQIYESPENSVNLGMGSSLAPLGPLGPNIMNSEESAVSSSNTSKSSSSDVLGSLIGSNSSLSSVLISSNHSPREALNSVFSQSQDEQSYVTNSPLISTSPKRKRSNASISKVKKRTNADVLKKKEISLVKENAFKNLNSLSTLNVTNTNGSNGVPTDINISNSVPIKQAINKSMDDVVSYLRDEVNSIIRQCILNNSHLKKEQQTSLLDSFASQFIFDYRHMLSKQFLTKLKENDGFKVLDKEMSNQSHLQQQPLQSHQHHQSHHHHHDHGHHSNQQSSSKKSLLNSWLTNPNPSQALNVPPNTNLIPLSPLLNDSDTEYNAANASAGALNPNSIENLTHLPGININSGMISNSHNSNSNSFIAPSQMSSIQNQNQQLPSFNSIQNKLPLSPGNGVNSGVFSGNSTSLIPPINNNATSTTLNPSHLLKSSNTKGFTINLNQPSTSLLNDVKSTTNNNSNNNNNNNSNNNNSNNNSANNLLNSFANSLYSSSGLGNSHGNTSNPFNNPSYLSGLSFTGVSSNSGNNPVYNNNANQTLPSGFNNRDNQTLGNSGSGNHGGSNILNNMGNFNEPGW